MDKASATPTQNARRGSRSEVAVLDWREGFSSVINDIYSTNWSFGRYDRATMMREAAHVVAASFVQRENRKCCKWDVAVLMRMLSTGKAP